MVATCERPGDMPDTFVKSLVHAKMQLKPMEKADRELCIKWLLNNEPKLRGIDLNITDVAKHLQGKTFKEIRNTLIKVLRGARDNLNQEGIEKRLA